MKRPEIIAVTAAWQWVWQQQALLLEAEPEEVLGGRSRVWHWSFQWNG
jgi:hypothetical protein